MNSIKLYSNNTFQGSDAEVVQAHSANRGRRGPTGPQGPPGRDGGMGPRGFQGPQGYPVRVSRVIQFRNYSIILHLMIPILLAI